MKNALVDTDIQSLFFKGEQNVVSHFRTYLKSYPRQIVGSFKKFQQRTTGLYGL